MKARNAQFASVQPPLCDTAVRCLDDRHGRTRCPWTEPDTGPTHTLSSDEPHLFLHPAALVALLLLTLTVSGFCGADANLMLALALKEHVCAKIEQNSVFVHIWGKNINRG